MNAPAAAPQLSSCPRCVAIDAMSRDEKVGLQIDRAKTNRDALILYGTRVGMLLGVVERIALFGGSYCSRCLAALSVRR